MRPPHIDKEEWDQIPYDLKPVYDLNDIGEPVWRFGKIDEAKLMARLLGWVETNCVV